MPTPGGMVPGTLVMRCSDRPAQREQLVIGERTPTMRIVPDAAYGPFALEHQGRRAATIERRWRQLVDDPVHAIRHEASPSALRFPNLIADVVSVVDHGVSLA